MLLGSAALLDVRVESVHRIHSYCDEMEQETHDEVARSQEYQVPVRLAKYDDKRYYR